jgi:hypothetical protein
MKTAEGNRTDIIEMQIGSKNISLCYNELKKHVPVLYPLFNTVLKSIVTSVLD